MHMVFESMENARMSRKLMVGQANESNTNEAGEVLSSNRGFTLVELLCAALITVMIAGMLAMLTGLVGNTVEKITAFMNSRVVCNTLTVAVQDELRYASNLDYDNGVLWFKSGGIGFGSRCRLAAVDEDDNLASRGYLALYTGTGTETSGKNFQRKLVEKNTYPNGLTASVDIDWNAASYKITATISIFDSSGNVLETKTFNTLKSARDVKASA